ncbi:MAG TPA: CBS domain-containing protein [Chloroflexi bacterium]|nr:CBS domain-containing protein [Chloroflexota bacterium]
MLKVADIMTPHPYTAELDTPLGEVLNIMRSRGCRHVPVMDGDRLAGIVSDRDVRLAMNSPLVLHERDDDQRLLATVTAEACMTPDPMTISPDAPAHLAADLMKTYKFGGLPVVKEGRLVGIVTVTDILSSYIALLREDDSPS